VKVLVRVEQGREIIYFNVAWLICPTNFKVQHPTFTSSHFILMDHLSVNLIFFFYKHYFFYKILYFF